MHNLMRKKSRLVRALIVVVHAVFVLTEAQLPEHVLGEHLLISISLLGFYCFLTLLMGG